MMIFLKSKLDKELLFKVGSRKARVQLLYQNTNLGSMTSTIEDFIQILV